MFPPALKREILVALVIKAVALTALYWLFFSAPHRIELGPGRIQAHLLSQRTSPRPESWTS